jgi:glucose-1-phosphate thymidylyltransferase
LLKNAVANVVNERKAAVFGYYVTDPERYGVCTFDNDGNVTTIEEKPVNPKSNYAVVGLYFYPNSVVNVAEAIKPSARGELEITSINQEYLDRSELKVELMGRGYAWLDTGTHESLMEASQFIETIEKRTGLKVACLEEIAYQKGWITPEQLREQGESMKKNQYGQYILNLLK